MADTTYGSQTLTAMFDTSAEAERAVARLRAAGVSDSSIRVTAGTSGDASTTASDQNKGFFESLGDFFFPDEDRYTYAEGLARGAQLVTVSNYDEAHYDTIVDILDDEGSVDLEAREEEWKSAGWSDYKSSSYYDEDEYNRNRSGMMSPAAAGMAAGTAAAGGMPARGTVYDDGLSDRDATISETGAGAVGTATGFTGSDYGSATTGLGAQATRSDDLAGSDYAATSRTDTDVDRDGTVKVMEERLQVGKREVEGGRVRVRAYVREEPVSAEVNLRSTRVYLDRRPVDRAATSADLDFRDQTLEAREHSEEAMVSKEARVTEEIGLREESESHTETISDTVRKTEVEIEDERTGEVTRVTGDDATRTDRDRF